MGRGSEERDGEWRERKERKEITGRDRCERIKAGKKIKEEV